MRLPFVVAAIFAGPLAAAAPAADARFDPVRTLLNDQVESKRIAGAVAAVSSHGRTVFAESVGMADVEAGRKMTGDTLFRIASMSKLVTSVTALTLVDDGQLALDDPIAKFIPAFADATVLEPGANGAPVPMTEPLTVRHLLTHTAGLTYSFWGEDPHSQLIKDAGVAEGLAESDLTLEQSVDRLAAIPLIAQPGTQWRYSLATDVLGRVIEVASGQTLDVAMRDRVLDPLGMDSTYFRIPESEADRLAALYRLTGETIERVPDEPQWEGNTVHSATYQLPGRTNYLSGGAGLVSTAGDYLRLLQMLLGGGERDGVRVLDRGTVRQLTTNQIGELTCGFPIHGDKFGLGVGIHSKDSGQKNGASPDTFGWAGFFYTYFWADPHRDLAGVLMVQLHPSGDQTLWADFQQTVYDSLDAVALRPAAIDDEQPLTCYREVVRATDGNLEWRVTAPRSTARGATDFLPNPVLDFEIDSLDGVTEARLTIDRWGGHLGTVEKSIRLNDNPWLVLPEIDTTPGNPVHYYSQDSVTVAVPIEHLREGRNTIEGTCATEEGHNWGQWGLYAMRLRLAVPEPNGLPDFDLKSVATDEPERLLFDIDAPEAEEFALTGRWLGEDDDGDGHLDDWHEGFRQPERGGPAVPFGAIAHDADPPFERVAWNTTWVPDQDEPIRLRLRVRHDRYADHGDRFLGSVWRMREFEGVELNRRGRRVALVASDDVPEHFGCRVGETKDCTVALGDLDPADVTDARISLRTWHGWGGHHDDFDWNGAKHPLFGKNHHFDQDLIPVAGREAAVRQENTFTIHSETHHHMLEVLWPGPLLLVETKGE